MTVIFIYGYSAFIFLTSTYHSNPVLHHQALAGACLASLLQCAFISLKYWVAFPCSLCLWKEVNSCGQTAETMTLNRKTTGNNLFHKIVQLFCFLPGVFTEAENWSVPLPKPSMSCLFDNTGNFPGSIKISKFLTYGNYWVNKKKQRKIT